jgi:hypothetical protein
MYRLEIIYVLPRSFSTLLSRPMVLRCFGVATDRAITSPIPSWKPIITLEGQSNITYSFLKMKIDEKMFLKILS